MNFFKRFPTMVGQADQTPRVITDIIRRVAVMDRYRDIASFLTPYVVQDGETPEAVSNKFYGTAGYHWVLMLINDITNPREAWPKKSRDLLDAIYHNYDFAITVPTAQSHQVGDILESNQGYRFAITRILPPVSGNRPMLIRSERGFVPLSASNTMTNQRTTTSGLSLTTVVHPTDRTHHWETADGLVVLTGEQSINGSTYTGALDIIPITIATHEERLNDAKRTVRVLDRTYLEQFVREFDTEIQS